MKRGRYYLTVETTTNKQIEKALESHKKDIKGVKDGYIKEEIAPWLEENAIHVFPVSDTIVSMEQEHMWFLVPVVNGCYDFDKIIEVRDANQKQIKAFAKRCMARKKPDRFKPEVAYGFYFDEQGKFGSFIFTNQKKDINRDEKATMALFEPYILEEEQKEWEQVQAYFASSRNKKRENYFFAEFDRVW